MRSKERKYNKREERFFPLLFEYKFGTQKKEEDYLARNPLLST